PQPAKAERLKPEAAVTVSPELAALIRQMLSEAPPVRGSAAEVAQALMHAEKTAGRKANRRITQRWARVVAHRVELFRSRHRGVEWLGWGAAAVLGMALAVLLWRSEHGMQGARPAKEVRAANEEDTAALAGGALKQPQGTQLSVSEQSGLGRDMQEKPFSNQRRPPCAKQEVEIHGGCWLRQPDTSPPCMNGYFAWKNGCYWPVLLPQPPATSDLP
ncbi:MAG TPA: serine/threonine protein kinase, partial [Myxococcaceae bacterium]|nr:serine/threonine protein kinase [Myxococcaceae bacterium]